MKTIIIDDEIQAISALKSDIEKHCPELNIIASANSVATAIRLINDLQPQLIFLDIQLNDGTGFDILDAVKHIPLQVIFTTAYSQYAIKAIKQSALDYLLKPIDAEDLIVAVNKALELPKQNYLQQQVEILKEEMQQINTDKKIVLKDNKSIYFVKTNQIIRCEANGAYTIIHLHNEPKIVVSKLLKELEQMLQTQDFIRTHHSHLVNLQYIKQIDKQDGGFIILSDGSEIPIAQRKKDFVMQYLIND